MISKPTKIERTKTVRLATSTKDLDGPFVSVLVSEAALALSDVMLSKLFAVALNMTFGEKGDPKARSKAMGNKTKDSNMTTRSEAEKGLIVPNSVGDFIKTHSAMRFITAVLELSKQIHSRTRRNWNAHILH